MIAEAAIGGADIVVLPEIFNSPYQAKLFPLYAESFPGPTTDFLAKTARQNKVCIVGGSIIEKDQDNRLYNSSFVFDGQGNLLGRNRKLHLFDIDIPGKVSFKESDTLTPGQEITVINYKDICLGLMICYDIRFPELARIMALQGAQIIVVPAAFTYTTGAAHWEFTMRCRAVDNQVFVVAASPARESASNYQVWGHSMIVNPWGDIVAQLGEEEGILWGQLNLAQIHQVRNELPLLRHRRTDLYQITRQSPI